jgi:hypothetical protein
MTRCDKCGQPLNKRSNPDHKRLFALIKAAYDQWPESSCFKPVNAEHLRAWLVCKAGPGFRRVSTFDLGGLDSETRMLVLDVMKDEHTFGGCQGDILYKVQPLSMRFDKMPQKQFAILRQEIEDVIKVEIGVEADDLLKQHEAAA